ncbi:uncharacterized protein LOC124453332 [Xenia sp. Carnegie-2017]|uniref:uncharacterized protein LOC124453332 n=1 Tax=Xenia sp. Carnegie-2017 TaxID=2897299 RepID=UPI001F04606C|nr:uncharacterized protein LOC124453332 [Xenia sp. Carnegie-2017]
MRRLIFLHILGFLFYKCDGTRVMPTVIWDYNNGLLSCKYNWLNSLRADKMLTMNEVYDHIHFVCPTPSINVKMLASSRPGTRMNYNVFMRKWSGEKDENGLRKLRDLLENGTFCDPRHSETKALYTCRNGNEGQSITINFTPQEKFYENQLIVFFNNEEDGNVQSLSSQKKKCAMAFITLLTWRIDAKYDMTYSKITNISDPRCKSVTLDRPTPKPSTMSTTQNTTKTTPSITTNITKFTPSITTNTTKTAPSIKTNTMKNVTTKIRDNTTTKPPAIPRIENLRSSSSDGQWNFLYGLLTGGLGTLVVVIISFITYYVIKKRGKKTESSSSSENQAMKQFPPGIDNRGYDKTISRDKVIV